MYVIRVVVLLIAITEGSMWSVFAFELANWRAPMAGAGDGVGPARSSDLPSCVLAGAIGLLLISPYICMAFGSLNLIVGKSLRVAYIYSLFVLFLMTLLLFMTLQRRFELMALGNIIAGGFWAYGFRASPTPK